MADTVSGPLHKNVKLYMKSSSAAVLLGLPFLNFLFLATAFPSKKWTSRIKSDFSNLIAVTDFLKQRLVD